MSSDATLASLMMLDLGTSTRDRVYAPDADSRGNMLNTTTAQADAIRARVDAHRLAALATGDEKTNRWNTPSNFMDVGEKGLANHYSGQGYRFEPEFNGGRAVSTQSSTIPRSASLAAPASVPPRGPRAGSPSAHGGYRFENGLRLEIPVPNRHLFNNSNTARTTQPGTASFGRYTQGRRGTRNGANRDRLWPRHQVANQQKYTGMTEAQMIEASIAVIVAAASDGTLGGDRLLPNSSDAPEVSRIKVQICDAAILSDKPSEILKKKSDVWAPVFHFARKWFIDVAFWAIDADDIKERAEKLDPLKGYSFEKTILADVIEAIEIVSERGVDAVKSDSSLGSKYRTNGKFDVLKKAVQYVVDKSTPELETSFEQTIEHVDPNDTDAQMSGVTTTITGPPVCEGPDATPVAADPSARASDKIPVAADPSPSAPQSDAASPPATGQVIPNNSFFQILYDGRPLLNPAQVIDLPPGIDVEVCIKPNHTYNHENTAIAAYINAIGALCEALVGTVLSPIVANDVDASMADQAVESVTGGVDGGVASQVPELVVNDGNGVDATAPSTPGSWTDLGNYKRNPEEGDSDDEL